MSGHSSPLHGSGGSDSGRCFICSPLGGRVLPYAAFWRRPLRIENVVAIRSPR